jgi:hypothetical protein
MQVAAPFSDLGLHFGQTVLDRHGFLLQAATGGIATYIGTAGPDGPAKRAAAGSD